MSRNRIFITMLLVAASLGPEVQAAGGERDVARRLELAPIPAPPLVPQPPPSLTGPIRVEQPSTTIQAPLAQTADRAAWLVAGDIIREEARRAYYLAGMHSGLREALNRSDLGRWDFHEGVKFGRTDPAVAEAGWPEAEPGTRVSAPGLEQVFRSVPLASPIGLGAESVDAWQLYRRASVDDAFEDAWRQPEFAFEVWCTRHPTDPVFADLDDDDRHRFRRLFELSYPAALASQLTDVPIPLYERGFRDGWAHGVRVRREWDFLRGYHLGFEERARELATDETFWDFDRLSRNSIESPAHQDDVYHRYERSTTRPLSATNR